MQFEFVVRSRWVLLFLQLAPSLLVGCKPSNPAAPPVAHSTSQVEFKGWQKLDDGIELGRFPAPGSNAHELLIVRIDGSRCELSLLACHELGHDPLPADRWAEKYGLSVVTNAGMFETDHSTHTGYMKNQNYVRPSVMRKDYSSLAAFSPVDPTKPPFRLYDTDAADSVEAIESYGVVIQNLRLIKRPRENRWQQQAKAWSEAALGEDAEGRMLMIFCPVGATMHDLNEHLLKLPIHLVSAQHLEGGPEASLYVKCGGLEIRGIGSYETGFNENNQNSRFWPLPNMIGVSASP